MRLSIDLNREQEKALREHATKKGRELDEDLLLVWWGRMRALSDYAEKLADPKAKFRPYTPKGLDEEERAKIVTLALKEGIATAPPKKVEPKPRKPKAAAVTGARKTKKAKASVNAAPTPLSEALGRKRKVKATLINEGDSADTALTKAVKLEGETGQGAESILKAAGRDKAGKPVKP